MCCDPIALQFDAKNCALVCVVDSSTPKDDICYRSQLFVINTQWVRSALTTCQSYLNFNLTPELQKLQSNVENSDASWIKHGIIIHVPKTSAAVSRSKDTGSVTDTDREDNSLEKRTTAFQIITGRKKKRNPIERILPSISKQQRTNELISPALRAKNFSQHHQHSQQQHQSKTVVSTIAALDISPEQMKSLSQMVAAACAMHDFTPENSDYSLVFQSTLNAAAVALRSEMNSVLFDQNHATTVIDTILNLFLHNQSSASNKMTV